MLVQYTGKNSEVGPSPRIWSRFLLDAAQEDLNIGRGLFDDYRAFQKNAANQYSGALPYFSYEDTGSAISAIATEQNGVIRLATDTSNNDDIILTTSTGTANGGVLGALTTFAGGGKRVAFECRVRTSSATANHFFGLGEEALAVSAGIIAAGNAALTSKDLIGFWGFEGSPGVLACGYRKAGQATQTITATATTLVASTWVKLGFTFEPEKSDLLTYYVNGEIVGTPTTSPGTTLFPSAQQLALYFNSKNHSTGVARNVDVDWWEFFQDIR